MADKKSKKEETKKKRRTEGEIINQLAEVNEAYFVGLLWSNPAEHYDIYGGKIDSTDFLHKIWGFYYGLGKKLFDRGIRKFDDISVNALIKETGSEKLFDKFNGLDTIDEAVALVEENELNIEYYYETVVKNKTLLKLIDVFGEKVLKDDGNYDYRELSATELILYWGDVVNQISLDGVHNYESESLYIEGEKFIENLEEQTANMMKFYRSPLMNQVTQGVPRGEVTIIGGFGNTGKSSIMAEKLLMACIDSQEKTLLILNEETAQKMREKLLFVLLNHHFNTRIDRKKMANSQKLTDDNKKKIIEAFDLLHELMDGDEAMIQVAYMENYNVPDLKSIVKYHASRGCINLIIDTHKVPDQIGNQQRWVAFVEATKEIYKFTKKEAGGFNLRTVLTVQLADAMIAERFLGFDAIGEGKGIKNEASIMLMFRPLFGDEIESLDVYRNKEMGDGWSKQIIELDSEKTYYVMFFPKNRFGGNTDNGQPCLVLEANFNFNSFPEIGWTHIPRQYNRRG